MALVEPHYSIQQIVVDPVSDILRIKTTVQFLDSVTGDPIPVRSNLGPPLDTPAVGGQITAIKAIVLAAAKQHFGTLNVVFSDPPPPEGP